VVSPRRQGARPRGRRPRAQRRRVYDLEARLVTDDDQRWVRTIGVPVTEDGEVVGLRGSIQDVTDRKERERELERTNERLDEFASLVGHDLRNPLQVAESRLELVGDEYDDDQGHLDAIERAHSQMESLVENLLALARTGGSVEDPERIDLASFARQCWDTVETGDARLAVDTDRTVEGSRTQLRRLFENLFHNSVEHGATGPSGADASLTVTVGDCTDPPGFYVADDGPGIPPAQRESVFEPGHSTDDDGTGFGLSIVQEVAEMHDWQVTVTESDAGGARFAFTRVGTGE
jgi:signal transduction histidine kinase